MKQSTKLIKVIGSVALLGLGSLSHAWAAGDATKGVDVFAEECGDCHSVKEGKNKKGPSLMNIVGRKAGSIEGYKYSDGMKKVDFVWSAEQISAYITHPRKIVPGGKMKYDGLDDEQGRADIVAYLATLVSTH